MEFGKTELIAAGISLSSIIGTLWALLMRMLKRDQDDLKTCREMHEQANLEIKELYGEYRELKGRMDAVQALSKAVLSKLEEGREHDEERDI